MAGCLSNGEHPPVEVGVRERHLDAGTRGTGAHLERPSANDRMERKENGVVDAPPSGGPIERF